MMNASIKAALKNPQFCCFQLRSFFHSTPFLERGRRNNWNSRFNSNKNFGRYRRNRFKDHMLKDANAYVDNMFKSWESDFGRDEQPSSKGPSWFHRSNSGSSGDRSQRHHNKGRRGFSFCEDEDDDSDVETVFRSAFGDRFFFWSFVNEDHRNGGRRSSRHSNSRKSSWSWKDQSEDEYDYTPEDDTRKSNLASERTALGLSASGPLKLEDVKNAYRASALKWHPDRHHGSSKADAEEKFKHCTAAYQSLCDSLAVN